MAAPRGARNPRVRPTGFRGVSTPQFCALRKIKKKIRSARRRRSRRSIPLAPSRHRKAPLPGELSAKLTERLLQICNCLMPPAAPSFPSCRKRRGRKGALGRGLVRPASESRVYLKTPNAPGQRTFSRCAAPFFLEIRQYSCEKMSCSAQKFLAAGHIGSFQIHPTYNSENCKNLCL